jgi:hypothetical protein
MKQHPKAREKEDGLTQEGASLAGHRWGSRAPHLATGGGRWAPRGGAATAACKMGVAPGASPTLAAAASPDPLPPSSSSIPRRRLYFFFEETRRRLSRVRKGGTRVGFFVKHVCVGGAASLRGQVNRKGNFVH